MAIKTRSNKSIEEVIQNAGAINDNSTCAANTTATGLGITTANPGRKVTFTITSRDSQNFQRKLGGDVFEVKLKPEVGGDEIKVGLNDREDGTYLAEYTVDKLYGKLTLSVCLRGADINGSPFSVLVEPPKQVAVLQEPLKPFAVLEEPPRPFAVLGEPPKPFAVPQEPLKPFAALQEPPKPFAVLGEPPGPFAALEEPPRPFAVLQKPPNPFALLEEPPKPFAVLQKPPDPFALLEEPPNPFAVLEEPPKPFAVLQKSPNPFADLEEPPKPFAVCRRTSKLKAKKRGFNQESEHEKIIRFTPRQKPKNTPGCVSLSTGNDVTGRLPKKIDGQPRKFR